MAGIGNYRLSDALRDQGRPAGSRGSKKSRASVDQTHKAHESEEARDAEASIRDRMVRIGRGNQQAGRQGQ